MRAIQIANRPDVGQCPPSSAERPALEEETCASAKTSLPPSFWAVRARWAVAAGETIPRTVFGVPRETSAAGGAAQAARPRAGEARERREERASEPPPPPRRRERERGEAGGERERGKEGGRGRRRARRDRANGCADAGAVKDEGALPCGRGGGRGGGGGGGGGGWWVAGRRRRRRGGRGGAAGGG